MKKNWLLVPVVVAMAGAALVSAAPDADEKVPADIQALMDKVRAGVPLNEAEQKKLSDYGLRDRNKKVEDMTFDDVMAIINSARATGKEPSAADQARIKAWSESMQAQKGKLEKDAEQLKKLSGTAGGPRRAPPKDLHDGRVHLLVTQKIKSTATIAGREDDGDETVVFDVTYPVKFDVHDEGERGLFRIMWRMGLTDEPVTGTYGVNTIDTQRGERGGLLRETLTAQFPVQEPAIRTGATTDGELVLAHGGRRPFLQVNVTCPTMGPAHMHSHETPAPPQPGSGGGSTSVPDQDKDLKVVAMPVMGVATDGILEEAPLLKTQLPPKTMPDIRRQVLEKMPARVTKGPACALCTFDVAQFREKWAHGQPFSIPVTYQYIFSLDEPSVDGGHDSSKGSMSSNAKVTFEFGPRDDEFVIEPESLDVYKKWLPVPFTDDAQIAKAFTRKSGTPKDSTQDDSVTLPVVVRWKPRREGGGGPPAAGSGAGAGATGGSAGKTPAGAGGAGVAGGTAGVPDEVLPTGIIKLHWEHVSENKGICGNYPVKDAKPAKGLFFPRTIGPRFQQDPRLDINADGTEATTNVAVSSITIKVAARESGAYGLLVAECPELGLTAKCLPNSSETFSIPEDDDGNHIADGWLDRKYLGHAGTWDDDSQPTDQRENGDGLTLYEEYRGFLCLDDPEKPDSWIHVRTDPDKKDVFCYDQDLLVKKNYFPENPSRLEWHFLDKNLMRFSGKPDDPENRWFNYNTPDELQYAPQYAIHALEDNTLKRALPDKNGKQVVKDGVPQTIPYAGGTNFIPGRDGVTVPLRDNFECRLNMAAVSYGFDSLLTMAPYKGDPAKLAILAQTKKNFNKSTVIHEIGHYLGIHHHFPVGAKVTDKPWPETDDSIAWGVLDCCMRYDNDPVDVEPVLRGEPYPCRSSYCKKDQEAKGPPDGKTSIRSDDCFGQIKIRSERK